MKLKHSKKKKTLQRDGKKSEGENSCIKLRMKREIKRDHQDEHGKIKKTRKK